MPMPMRRFFVILTCLWLGRISLGFVPTLTTARAGHHRLCSSSSSFSQTLAALPRVIVFDLDNTLWTPELYTLRKLQRANQMPVAGRDVQLFEDARRILMERIPELQQQAQLRGGHKMKLAVASRTQSGEWAQDLLDQFDMRSMMDGSIEIFPGSKLEHFGRIQKATGAPFHEMMFLDDARDGKYGNCEPVAGLGVLCVHCPNGITTELFERAIDVYQNEWDKIPSTIVEWDGSVTTSTGGPNLAVSSETWEGSVKMVRPEKKYGFIRYRNGQSKDVFFHFNNLLLQEASFRIQEGDQVTFHQTKDPKNGKDMAVNVAITASPDTSSLVEMRCFSMNQPFAALLANGVKTLETRNGTMFSQYSEGTQMLVHVGQRTYPDKGKHVEVFKAAGMSDEDVERGKALPNGFGRGNIIAILELGKTYETTLSERSDPSFERKVGAYGADSGRIVTEIKRVAYLKKPIQRMGEGGVFNVRIDPAVLPDGFHVPSNIGNKETHGGSAYASISGS